MARNLQLRRVGHGAKPYNCQTLFTQFWTAKDGCFFSSAARHRLRCSPDNGRPRHRRRSSCRIRTAAGYILGARLCAQDYPAGRLSKDTPVGEVMSYPAITITPDESVEYESKATTPKPAKSSAVAVVTMTRTTSLCLIGMSRKVRIWLYFSTGPATGLATFSNLELSLSPAFSAAD